MKKLFAVVSIILSLESFAISVDGVLDEAEWENAKSFSTFYLVKPFTLDEAENKTDVKIFTNQDGIYVGFINIQDPSTMGSYKHVRDEWNTKTDRNAVYIDFDGDGNTAYTFMLSLGDSLLDSTISNGNNQSYDWNGDWIGATKINTDNWVSEIFIPWSTANMIPVDGKRDIKFGAYRYRASNGELIGTAKTNPQRNKFMYELNTLEIDSFPASSSIDYFPYIVAAQDSVTNNEINKVGVEIFYNTGTGKQINATINPDFGQVESDDVVVNFSAEETLYGEKRAFFNENQTLFDITDRDRLKVMHTRRIGSKPSYNCSEATNEDLCNESKQEYSDLDYALRYTQKEGGTEYGFFTASEQDEDFSIGRSYYAARVKKEDGNTTLGYMLTYTDDPILNRTAMVNAFDYDNIVNEKLRLYSILLHAEAEDKSSIGVKGGLRFRPTKDDNHSIGFHYYGDDLNINDMGYLQKNDWIALGGRSSFDRFFDENSKFQDIEYSVRYGHNADTNGNSSPTYINPKIELTLKNTSVFNFWTTYESSGKNTTITRKFIDSPFIKRPAKYNYGMAFNSKNYSNSAFGIKANFERGSKNNSWNSDGYKKTWMEASYYFFPLDFLTMKMGFSLRDQQEWLKWIDTNHLAAYDANEKFLTFDLNYFEGNKHELRLKAQFVALKANNPTSLESNNTGYLTASDKTVNSFNVGEAAFQIRYKYELAPLSNLYIVYSQGGNIFEENIDSNTTSIVDDSWSNPSGKVFAVKLRLRF